MPFFIPASVWTTVARTWTWGFWDSRHRIFAPAAPIQIRHFFNHPPFVLFYVVPPGLPFPLVFPVGYNEIQVLSPVAQTITYS